MLPFFMLGLLICKPLYFFHPGSNPRSKPKREKTEEEKTFRKRAKYFLVTQLAAVLIFLSLLGGSDNVDMELDNDDGSIY